MLPHRAATGSRNSLSWHSPGEATIIRRLDRAASPLETGIRLLPEQVSDLLEGRLYLSVKGEGAAVAEPLTAALVAVVVEVVVDRHTASSRGPLEVGSI